VWTFTSYIIWRLYEEVIKGTGREYVTIDELADFVFNTLWKKYRLVLNDSTAELEREIRYLAKLGAVEYDRGGRIKVREKLGEIARAVARSSLNDRLTLYPEYLRRIDQAIREVKAEYVARSKLPPSPQFNGGAGIYYSAGHGVNTSL